ncbi:hypothetical protein RR46_03503 [Papilio xuthus]|uniref:Uncharacterized protein n=1 Tax=Papilio xuthus TaxID=66420 RepID=A0A194QDA1_PAPXU|nr:hypothetical protein RR46_03503 [Papilio xuthus]
MFTASDTESRGRARRDTLAHRHGGCCARAPLAAALRYRMKSSQTGYKQKKTVWRPPSQSKPYIGAPPPAGGARTPCVSLSRAQARQG